jgi:hypothetical protein
MCDFRPACDGRYSRGRRSASSKYLQMRLGGVSELCQMTSRRILPDMMRETSRTSSTICVKESAFRSRVSRPRDALSPDRIPPRSRRE